MLPSLIIDNGTGYIKSGLSQYDEPHYIFPNAIEIIDDENVSVFTEGNRESSEVRYPLSHGIIESVSDMTVLWDYIYDSILTNSSSSSSDFPVLLTEPPFNPDKIREEVAQYFFETKNTPLLNFSVQGVCSLLATGKTSGVVLDCGDGVTHSVPIFENYVLSSGVCRLDIGGRDLNKFIAYAMSKCFHRSFIKQCEIQILKRIKERYCYTLPQSPDVLIDGIYENTDIFYKSLNPGNSIKYTKSSNVVNQISLPDGEVINLKTDDEFNLFNNISWLVPEVLFNPGGTGIVDGDDLGVSNLLVKSILSSPIDTQSILSANIVLSGGSTLFPNFSERVEHDLKYWLPHRKLKNAVKVLDVLIDGTNPSHLVWKGGKLLADMREVYDERWVSIDEYFEYGPRVFHSKLGIRLD